MNRIDGQEVRHPSFWRLLAAKAQESEPEENFDSVTSIKKFRA
jgi:hypothetical protein